MFQNIYCALANIKIVIPLSIMSNPSGCMMECCTPHPGSILISGMTKLRASYRIRFTLGSIFRMRENAWWVSPGNAYCLLTCNLSFTYKDENGLNLRSGEKSSKWPIQSLFTAEKEVPYKSYVKLWNACNGFC